MSIPQEIMPFVKPGLSPFIENYFCTLEDMIRGIAEDRLRNLMNSRNFNDAAKAPSLAQGLLQAAAQLSESCKLAVLEVIESIL